MLGSKPLQGSSVGVGRSCPCSFGAVFFSQQFLQPLYLRFLFLVVLEETDVCGNTSFAIGNNTRLLASFRSFSICNSDFVSFPSFRTTAYASASNGQQHSKNLATVTKMDRHLQMFYLLLRWLCYCFRFCPLLQQQAVFQLRLCL